MMTLYSLEAVRDFTAIDSDIVVKRGEILTLLLDNSKFCLVHRSDDLPFVVPKPWVVLRIDENNNNRTGSFSKFLRKRDCLKDSLRKKYPMCTYDLKAARPRFAAVTTDSSATSLNEVDVKADTSVLILDADPQNLFRFGITQSGTFGMIPRYCLSFITNPLTPSLQAGSRLFSSARMTYEAQDSSEVSITRGSTVEVIGMPQLWKWQVRTSEAKRKVGLLPVYVLSDVSVIGSPEDTGFKDDFKPQNHIARPPSGFDAEFVFDATSWQILQNAGTSCLKRRLSHQPLPLLPDSNPSGMLNDLNRPTDAVRYVNEGHNSFSGVSESDGLYDSVPHTLRSDEPCLRGVSSPNWDTASSTVDTKSLSEEAKEAIHGISRLLVDLERNNTTLAQTARRSKEQVDRWEQTAKAIQRLASGAMSESDSYYAYAYEHSRHRGEDYIMRAAMEGDIQVGTWPKAKEGNMSPNQTIPRPIPRSRQRRASVSSSPLQTVEEIEKSGQLQRFGSQPILDMVSDDHAVVEASPARINQGNLLHMLPSLQESQIEVITRCACPDGAVRPKIHWKPILIKLGLDPVKAREICSYKMSPQEEWKQALWEWKQQVGTEATMQKFLEELKLYSDYLYHEIFRRCGVKLKQKVSSTIECFV